MAINTTSFLNTPQATDDQFASATTGLTEDWLFVTYLAVMANDQGGAAKTLYSIDNGTNSVGALSPTDLLTQDIVRTEALTTDYSANGAKIWITTDGKVGYDAATLTAAFKGQLQQLSAGQFLTDTFTYAIRLGNGTLSWATATVQIAGVNDAPVVTGAVTGNALEDGSSVTLNALANVSDADAGATLSVTNLPGSLPPGVTYNALTHSFTLDPSNAAFQHLAAGVPTTVTVNYGVTDGTATTAASVSWTVTGTNDGPVAVADAAAGTENQTLTINVLANDTDVDDGHVFTLNAAARRPARARPAWWRNQVQFDPGSDFDHLAQGATEHVTLSYTMQDEHGAPSSSTVDVTITGTNDGPVAVADVAAGTENQTLTINVLANDTDVDDGHVFTLNAASAPAGKGSASVVANQVQFDPGTDFDHLAQGATEHVTLNYTDAGRVRRDVEQHGGRDHHRHQ